VNYLNPRRNPEADFEYQGEIISVVSPFFVTAPELEKGYK